MKPRILGSIFAIVLLLSTASVAFGHARFDQADPAPGATLDAAPTEVTIWYTEGIQEQDSWIHVLDGNGARVDQNDNTIVGDDSNGMTVHLRDGLASGLYTVSWQNLSEDGDGSTGSFQFGINASAPVTTSESEMEDHGDHDHEDEH
jgi:copper transport protein